MKRIIWLNYTSIVDQCAQNNAKCGKGNREHRVVAIDMHNQATRNTMLYTQRGREMDLARDSSHNLHIAAAMQCTRYTTIWHDIFKQIWPFIDFSVLINPKKS